MTAAVALASRKANGMRAVDPRRDLVGLAMLIEEAFAGSLDAQGREMTREMRRFGRLGWIGWLVGHLFLPPAAFPQGYVWTEDGAIIGNASLLPVERAPQRWVLANVAVAPGHRRRGIARTLVGASLDLAGEKRAEEVVLQVKASNAGARVLYDRFGFVDRGTRTLWRKTRAAGSTGEIPARRRRSAEWPEHWALVRRLRPHGLVWPHPLGAGMFRPGTWASADPWGHWVWPNEGPMVAAASGRIDASGVFRMFIVAAAEARGRAEAPLVEAAMREPLRPGPIEVETDDEPGAAGLARLGFSPEHRLTWMGLKLPPRPERTP
ncbi:MAG TPA: GNAT family N-acetyltransferase [Anaerolineales bacterium]|nr:GNAT family N-acetyltransferase [Anaerolineales bacterium]